MLSMHVINIVGYYCYNKDYVHAKNECAFIVHACPSIVIFFWLISPLITNINMCNLLLFITFLFMAIQWLIIKIWNHFFNCWKIKNLFRKHHFNSSSWGMVKIVHLMLLNNTKATFVTTTFIAISAYEVTLVDNINGFRSASMWSRVGDPRLHLLTKLVSLPHV